MRKELTLSPNAKNLGQEEFDDIQMAIQQLSTASQTQFEEIKKETWYNRLWNMVTFSQEGKKRLADQIGTVAQAQQILVEMLLRLSDQDSSISELVMKNSTYIERIQRDNIYLLTEINLLKDKITDLDVKLKYDANIKGLNDEEKRALSGCLYNLVKLNDLPNDRQKEYVNTILNFVDENTRMENPFAAIEDFDTKTKGKLLACCMEYMFLENNSTDSFSKYQDFIDEFDCGKKTITDIEDQVVSIYNARGEQGFVDRYSFFNNKVSSSFYVDFDEELSEDQEDYDIINNQGIAALNNNNYDDKKIKIVMDALKQIKTSEEGNCNVKKEIAHAFFHLCKNNVSSETYETTNHIIYLKDNQIYLFSKLTGESKIFNIRKILIAEYSLSEATSDAVINSYISNIFYYGIKEYRYGMFFSVKSHIFYVDIDNNSDDCNLIINLSNVWKDGYEIRIKGIESDYFIFSYNKKNWCLLNLNTGKMFEPSFLENRTDKFVVRDNYIYYAKAHTSQYKANKGQQYGKKTDSIQIFEYNLITGTNNPVSEKIFPNIGQKDGLGLLEKFERVGDKYIMLRRTHFASNESLSFIGLLLATMRSSYLYIVFDSGFNPISGNGFKSIDSKNVFQAEYCKNGTIIYLTDDDDLKIISLISENRKTLGKEKNLHLVNCGNYHKANTESDLIINSNDI